MIIEGLTIAGIIGGCGLVAWYAKNKFQPEIEQSIEEQKKQEIELCSEIKETKRNQKTKKL